MSMDYHNDSNWTPIGQTSNQLILYHPSSHALTVKSHSQVAALPRRDAYGTTHEQRGLSPRQTIDKHSPTLSTCPYCFQPLPTVTVPKDDNVERGYFEILERAHDLSRQPSPRSRSESPFYHDEKEHSSTTQSLGYYERFFKEEAKLGSGAEGCVYLATHVIDGNVLGTYAVKKIAVGTSKSYLVKMLREVRLLENLRHPNIIPYHHSWIDSTQFSTFAEPIASLHILMMYASAGNLDSYILTRSYSQESTRDDSLSQLPKAERIQAFKNRHKNGGYIPKTQETRGVLMLSFEEIIKLFGDVVKGLAFLHANSVLHLDLKCSNVLLHWEEGQLIPKAIISDFGASEEMLRGKRERTGHTGTMEYMAPETLLPDINGQYRPSDSHADMWSLGMILHKLLFFRLPYTDSTGYDELEKEILAYKGFISSPDMIKACENRHIPRDLLYLLSNLVHTSPIKRPSAEKIRSALQKIDPLVVIPSYSGLGQLVTRFATPFKRRSTSTSPSPTLSSPPPSSSIPIINKWDHSPVQKPLLTLPSPLVSSNPSPIPTTNDWSLSIHSTILNNIKKLIFLIKILSLQPTLTGIQMNKIVIIGLTILGFICLQRRSQERQMMKWDWEWEIGFGILHVCVLFGYKYV